MFKCAAGHLSEPGEKRHRAVVELRPVEYEYPASGKVTKGLEVAREEDRCGRHLPKDPPVVLDEVKQVRVPGDAAPRQRKGPWR